MKKLNHKGEPIALKVKKIYWSYRRSIGIHDDSPMPIENIIEFKDLIKEYYKLDIEDQMAVFILIGRGYSLEEAIEDYKDYLGFICRLGTDWIQDETQWDKWCEWALERIGEHIIEDGSFYTEDCPERLKDFLDEGLIAKSLILDGSIYYETDFESDDPNYPNTYVYWDYSN